MSGQGLTQANAVGRPLARYAASRRMGDWLFCSGVIAVAPSGSVIQRYEQLPQSARDALRELGFDTGQLSVDVFEAPIVAQSWFVLDRIRELGAEHGVGLDRVARLVQYFTSLRDYPHYNRVRNLFFPDPVVSTVVEVSGMLPGPEVLVEVEATFLIKCD